MENNSEYDIEPKNNRPSKVYGGYNENGFKNVEKKELIDRNVLLHILYLSNNVNDLREDEILNILRRYMTKANNYINAFKNVLEEEEYDFSNMQNTSIYNVIKNIEDKNFLKAYFEIVNFIKFGNDDGKNSKIYISEIEEVQYLINLLEQAMPKTNNNEYDIEPKKNIPAKVYGVYRGNDFEDSLNKKISKREELLKKLEIPNGVIKLKEKDIIDAIQVAITRIKAYINENEFTEEEYKFSERQNATIESAINNINKKDYLDAYFEIVDFVDDFGDKHDGKVYKSEIEEVQHLINLLEQAMFKDNYNEYDIEPEDNIAEIVYGVYREDDFEDSLNKKTSKREELLKKLELPNGVRKLEGNDIIDIIQVAITRIKAYANENEFIEEEYKFSKRQNATIESAINNINKKDYLEAYFEIVDFVDDYGDKHDGKVYKSEIDKILYLLQLIEKNMLKK